MTDQATSKQAADAILAVLPPYVKAKLKAVFMQHGRNRKAMRSSNAIIKIALRTLNREKLRRDMQAVARSQRASEQVDRMAARDWQPLAGMSAERWEELRAIAMAGMASEEPTPESYA